MDDLPLASRAPAKINLTLQITQRRLDGWHELVSLVAFAGIGDHVELRVGRPLALLTRGPTAGATGPNDDNLVLRAARHLRARVVDLHLGEFHLFKRLPVASGVGGGSSDAAAALRLLARTNRLSLDDPRVLEAARATGADVPVCLDAQARMMSGVGERLGPRLSLPPMIAVLVNPLVALETRLVFARMGLQPGGAGPVDGPHPLIAAGLGFGPLLDALRRSRNDMEEAAGTLLPVVRDQLALLATAPGCHLARMSGSGATCFGLFEDRHAAVKAAQVIRRAHPAWWVRATMLR